jgi:hypothetical protein
VWLLVGIKCLAYADVAAGTVAASKTVEKAPVSLALVAVAVTRLLVENFFDAARDRVSVEDADLSE